MLEQMRLGKENAEQRGRFNYRGMHRYVISMETRKLVPVFTENDRVMRVLNVLRETCWQHQFDVYAYCFLPARLSMLLRGKASDSDMKALLADFRPASAAALGHSTDRPLWKRMYTERVLRRSEDSRMKAEELFKLPVLEGLASRPEDYPFQGSFVLNLKKR